MPFGTSQARGVPMCTMKFLLISLLAAATVLAQERPADAPHDMEHMQHGGGHGGFMQGGMHHAVAKGVSLQTKLDGVAHTITLREGPINLPANTNHMMMPQPPDLHWTIPMNAWLLAYSPRLVDANNKEEHIFGAGGEMTK